MLHCGVSHIYKLMLTAVSRKNSVIHNGYKCQYLISRHTNYKQSNNYIPFLNSRNITAKRKDIQYLEKYQRYSMFYVVIDHLESLSWKFSDRFAGRQFQMYDMCFERLSHFNSEIC